MSYRTPIVMNPRHAQHIRRALAGSGLGFLGANSAETLQLEVGPLENRLLAVAQGYYARGPVLDMSVTPHGITSQEASQLPARIAAALRDCGHEVEESKWGGGSGLESLAGKVYVRWRAHSRVRAVQHMNEVAAILASVAPAFGPQASLGVQRMRVNPGPLHSDVYAYLEPSVGLPPVVCDAARRTPVPEQEARTFTPAPSSAPEPAPAPGAPEAKVPTQPGTLDKSSIATGARRFGALALVGVGVVSLAVGFGLVSYYAYKADKAARVKRNRRRRRRRRRR